ncbi:hypothetical protein ACET3Z_013912 [Daucus carota]
MFGGLVSQDGRCVLNHLSGLLNFYGRRDILLMPLQRRQKKSADECEFRVWCHYNVIDGGITDSNYVDRIEVAADNNGFTDFRRPSGINNYDLINRVTTKGSDVCAELRDGLVEGTDYILLPKAVWYQLHAWEASTVLKIEGTDRADELKKNRIHSAFDRPLTMWEKYCLHHCFALLLGFTLPANTGSQGYLLTSYKGTCSIQILLKVQMSNRVIEFLGEAVNHVKCTSVIHRFDTLGLQPLGDIYQEEHFVNSLKDEVNIIKKLRCKCNFHALKSVPKLQEAGSLIIKRITKSDVSTNLVDKEEVKKKERNCNLTIHFPLLIERLKLLMPVTPKELRRT